MSPRRRSIAGLSLLLLLAGCAVPNRTNRNPGAFRATFANLTTFTCVPWSEITGDNSLASRKEDAMLFALANDLIARGYEYTPILDSADFVATVHITDSSIPSGDHVPPPPPPYRRAVPFGMIADSFASWAEQPTRTDTDSTAEVHPWVNGVLYSTDYEHEVLHNWMGWTDAKGANFWNTAQYVVARFANTVPFSPRLVKTWFGPGVSGLSFALRTQDGVNFWPEITFLFHGFPAEKSGLQLGDEILSVNGHRTQNLDYNDCMRLFYGDPGRQMVLNIWRYPDVTFSVTYTTVARDTVK